MNMKKIVAAIFILLFCGYIALMTAFEGPIRVENPECIVLNAQEETIELPWYLRAVAEHEFTMEAGHLSRFSYALPDVFESAEMHVVVSWADSTCVLYIGDSRAMEIIDADFPNIIWK